MPPSSVEVSRSPARPRARRILRALAQNFGLVLAWVVLVVAVIVYCIIYFAQQGVLPGNFEATSTINNTMPLVLTALGQTIVILKRGLDLSVGGIIDLTNALAALNFADNPGTMILWTVLILLTGAVLGLINGALVAIEPAIEAARGASVASGAGGRCAQHQCVLIAVDQHFLDREGVARGLALLPQPPAAAREEVCKTGLLRLRERFGVHEPYHQYRAARRVGYNGGQQSG